MQSIRIYLMIRHEDESGVSGAGVVGEVCQFSDGTSILKWNRDTNAARVASTVVYETLEDLKKVHSHGGKTTLVPMDSCVCDGCGYGFSGEQFQISGHLFICTQCCCENVSPLGKRDLYRTLIKTAWNKTTRYLEDIAGCVHCLLDGIPWWRRGRRLVAAVEDGRYKEQS